MKMLMLNFYTVYVLHVVLTLAMVHAQDDQSGFISIDCGSPQGSKYTDIKTGITYDSDAGFIEGGVSAEILPKYIDAHLDPPLKNLRSFPQNTRSCYTLRPKQGKNNRYLIRTRFMYGNYDSKNQTQDFYLYLGADIWGHVYITDPSHELYHEIIHLALSDYIHICLVKTGESNPFISAIELRFLDITMAEPPSTSLDVYYSRANFGSTELVSYGDDKYDRAWYPRTMPGTRVIKTLDTISSGYLNVPSKVMSTAITPAISTDDISFSWNVTTIDMYFFYLHFAEVEKLKSNETREFNIYLNGNHWNGPFSPSTKATTFQSTLPSTGSPSYTFKINKTLNSTLPPLVNAVEIYHVLQFQKQQTEDQDAAAIWSTKSTYGFTELKWQGDPCFPQAWVGLNCNYYDQRAAKIISLNLSSRGLSGQIATALANLTMLESLDLSYNNLMGNVPDFLAQLDNLKILNLTGNKFSRPLPAGLQAKLDKGLLSMSIEESNGKDKSSCLKGSCRNNKHKVVVISTIVVISSFIVILSAFVVVWKVKRRKSEASNLRDEGFLPRKQQFAYSEVVGITNNFQNVIGKGGFGSVFHGLFENSQVAVKMLSESSSQGYKEFQAEVKILMKIHHKNITSLVGYCNDSNHKGVIYDFMANGNLDKHLFDGIPNVLSWERRLQIGCDAAEGLAYLHHGCIPPIVHRDVKSSNILLNERFQAKLSDFGLSRAFPTEDATHVVSSKVVGTLGYLDPEYHSTNRLTEKSDVYSFGVVLLELITGRRAISEGINIINRVMLAVEEGHIENIIDFRLEGRFDINTAWKVAETAMACVSCPSIERPTMNNVVINLHDCLQAVKTCQTEYLSLNVKSVTDPSPR